MVDEKFRMDYYRMTGEKWKVLQGLKQMMGSPALRFLFYSRHRGNVFCKILKRRIKNRNGLEFELDNIGAGFYLGHPYNITINRDAVIGKCCNLHKGVTIGQESRGVRKGSPVIGNKVWIGINAVIVGKIIIGDDVLIAPNSYVNRDVPSHSIVLGNPCRIIPCEDATREYIRREIGLS